MRALYCATSFFAAITAASAQNVKWMNPEQARELGQLGNAFSAARNCNWTLSTEIIRKRLTTTFGPDLNTDKTVDVMLAVDGFSAMADELLFGITTGSPPKKAQLARVCGQMEASFGPKGNISPGLLVTNKR